MTLPALFVTSICVWLAVMAYAAPSVWQTMTGKPVRRGDPMRLGVFITGMVVVFASSLRLFAPMHVEFLAALFTLTILDGLFIIHLMRTYGRGGPL